MEYIHDRLREIRTSKGLNQTKFAKSLGIGQSTLAMLEVGKREILDRHIKTICSIYNVNEIWLKTGKGEMFIENDSTIITELVAEYRLDAIDQKIIEHYVNLDEHAREVLKKEVVSLAQEIVNLDETAATSEPDPSAKKVRGLFISEDFLSEDINVDAEVESYRKELEDMKKTQASSALHSKDEGETS